MNSVLMKDARLKALESEPIGLCTWLVQVTERCLTLNDHLARGRKHRVLLNFKRLNEEQHISIPKLSIFIKEEKIRLLTKFLLDSIYYNANTGMYVVGGSGVRKHNYFF